MDQTAVFRLRLDNGNIVPASDQAAKALGKIGATGEISAKQTAAALRGLPAQLTDVATQLAGGQNPLLILLQQGGQIKDQFGGIGPAIRGIGAAAAAVNPLTAALVALAVATGAVAFGFLAGANESEALRKSLVLTGNQAGVTLGQIDKMSQAIAASGRVTIGTARELTAGLVALGTFGGPALQSAARAAGLLADATGKSADEVVQSLAHAAEAPTQFANKANQAYHFLTIAQYDQIRALEAQGRNQEAAKLSLDLLANTMQQRTTPALTRMGQVLQTVKNDWSDFIDGFKSLGRASDEAPKFLDTLIEKAKQLYGLRQSGAIAPPGFLPGTFTPVTPDSEGAIARESQRLADRAKRQTAEDEKIRQSSAARQAALAGIEKAGASYRLAQLEGALAQSSDSLDRAFERDEVSARAYQTARLAIDLAGINAQESALAKQRSAEAARKPEKPEELLAQQAALIQLDAQRLALEQKRAKLLADEAAGKRDVSPKDRELPGDALRRINAALDQQVDREDKEAAARRVFTDRETLQQLQEQNERAAVDLIADEQEKGEALIALDKRIAQERLKLLDLSPDARIAANQLLNEKAALDGQALTRQLGQGAYDDLRGSIASALQDSSGKPVLAFAHAIGNAVQSRLANALADALARQAIFGAGGAGSGGGLLGLFGLNGSKFVSNNDANAYPSGVPLAVGMDYVPYDNFPALLHRGERVLTADQARSSSQRPVIHQYFTVDARADISVMAQLARDGADSAVRTVFDTMKANGNR